MEPQLIPAAITLMLGGLFVAAYEFKESLKPPVCPQCTHCLARLEEERVREAAVRYENAHLFDKDRDRDRRP